MPKITLIGLLSLVLFAPSLWAQWGGAQIQQVTDDSFQNRMEGLFIDENDRLYLFYAEHHRETPSHYFKLLSRTKAKGADWTGPNLIGNPLLKSSTYITAEIVYDSRTDLTHILYKKDFFSWTNAALYYTNSTVNNWELTLIESTTTYDEQYGDWLQIAVDSSGNIHLVWNFEYMAPPPVNSLQKSLDHYYHVCYATNSSGEWVKQTLSSDIWLGYSWSGPSFLSVQRNGIAHVTYYHPEGIFHLHNDSLGGTNWSVDTLPVPFGLTAVSNFVIDGKDQIHLILWGSDDYYSNYDYLCYYSRHVDSVHWEGPDILTDHGVMSYLVLDQEGDVHVSWFQTSGDLLRYDVFYANKKSGVWESCQILDETTAPRELAFIIDSDGEGHAAYRGYWYEHGFNRDSTEIFYLGAIDTAVEDTLENPKLLAFQLLQNYPNPFNTSTIISYEVNSASLQPVVLKIYNVLGEEVRTLVNTKQGKGRYQVKWNGKNDSGKEVASGIYFYVLSKQGERITKQMLFIK